MDQIDRNQYYYGHESSDCYCYLLLCCRSLLRRLFESFPKSTGFYASVSSSSHNMDLRNSANLFAPEKHSAFHCDDCIWTLEFPGPSYNDEPVALASDFGERRSQSNGISTIDVLKVHYDKGMRQGIANDIMH